MWLQYLHPCLATAWQTGQGHKLLHRDCPSAHVDSSNHLCHLLAQRSRRAWGRSAHTQQSGASHSSALSMKGAQAQARALPPPVVVGRLLLPSLGNLPSLSGTCGLECVPINTKLRSASYCRHAGSVYYWARDVQQAEKPNNWFYHHTLSILVLDGRAGSGSNGMDLSEGSSRDAGQRTPKQRLLRPQRGRPPGPLQISSSFRGVSRHRRLSLPQKNEVERHKGNSKEGLNSKASCRLFMTAFRAQ